MFMYLFGNFFAQTGCIRTVSSC